MRVCACVCVCEINGMKFLFSFKKSGTYVMPFNPTHPSPSHLQSPAILPASHRTVFGKGEGGLGFGFEEKGREDKGRKGKGRGDISR